MPGGYDPETGYPLPDLPSELMSVPCNYQLATAKEVRNKDNNVVLQNGKIFIDKGQQFPPRGTMVRVEPDMFSGEVVDLYTGQLGTKLIV